MKGLIIFSVVMILAGISSLTAAPTVASTGPLSQQTVAAPRGAVRIQHIWREWQTDALIEYREKSLGTIIAPNLILTHNHYTQPLGLLLEESLKFEDERGRAISWRGHDLQFTVVNDGALLIRLPTGAFPAQAVLGNPATAASLTVGAWLTVYYRDKATGQIAQRGFQIVQIANGVAKLADPDRLIRSGDSGGGVFLGDRLVGNTWSIDTDQAGNALGWVNVALMPTGIESLARGK